MQEHVKQKWFINQVIDALIITPHEIHPYARMVLIAISHYASPDGYCYPSELQISALSGIRTNHLSRYYKILKKLHILKIKRKYDKEKSMTRNFYKINIKGILEIITEDGKTIANLHPDSMVELLPLVDQKVNHPPHGLIGDNLNHPPERLIAHVQSTTGVDGNYISTTQTKHKQPKQDIVQMHKDDENLSILPISMFDKFWTVYPRKENKLRALTIWQGKKLDEKGDLIVQDILMRIEKHIQWRDKQFVPHASTYLNGERWNDEITEENYDRAKENNRVHRVSKTEESVLRAFDDYERAEKKRRGIS